MIKSPPVDIAQDYYTQMISWQGIRLLANSEVSELAMFTAAESVFNLLRYRPDIAEAIASHGGRYAIAPVGGVAVDLPEFSHLKGQYTFDGRLYDDVEALGGNLWIPLSSTTEANVLKLPSDRYSTQNVLIHEAAHLIENVGFDEVLRAELTAAYGNATQLPIWSGTYASANEDEYFATITEAYFGVSREDYIFGTINTRDKLKINDPQGYTLVEKIYGSDPWQDGHFIGSEGHDDISGTEVPDFLVGWDGDDTMFGGLGDDYINGGRGFDKAVFDSQMVSLTVEKTVSGFFVQAVSKSEGSDDVFDIERLDFANGVYALDVAAGDIAGSAYRLYQAAFARTPDDGGLEFWITHLDNGMSLVQAAEYFLSSEEARSVYGDFPSSDLFVDMLYQNVLRRAGEKEGFDFWVGVLDAKAVTTAEVLMYFSESEENIQLVGQQIGMGFWFDKSSIV